MIYLSKLLNQKVWDVFGRVVGRLEDVLVEHTEQSMPPIIAILVKDTANGEELIDASSLVTLWPSITLITRKEESLSYQPDGRVGHRKKKGEH